MKTIVLGMVVIAGFLLGACASDSIFPPDATKGVDPDFDFTRWRMLPNQAEGKKVQLGGRIIDAATKGETVSIVVAQLPIVEHPAYGPKDTGKSRGEFAVVYRGRIDPSLLQRGNRLIVVGMTQSPNIFSVDDLPKSLPTVEAICVHVWKTGGREIGEFPFNAGGGYQPLVEETLCTRNS